MMEAKPKVSVILPTYNRAGMLPRAVESVLGQDFHDLEVLIVDDGSTDNTENLVEKIKESDKRMRYVKLVQNRGVGFSRDIGLRHVLGEYIAFVDSDDLWLSDKLYTQVAILDRFPEIDILFSDYWNINHITGTKDRGFVQNQDAMSLLKVIQHDEGLYLVNGGLEIAILEKSFIHLQTILMRRMVINLVGGFDSSLRTAEDFEFCMRASLLGAQFAFTDHPFAERHKVESGLTWNRIHAWDERLYALQRCRRWIDKTERRDLKKNIRRAEDRAFRNLIWAYGRKGQRREALRSYLESLKIVFSLRLLLYILVAMLGPDAISLAARDRAAVI